MSHSLLPDRAIPGAGLRARMRSPSGVLAVVVTSTVLGSVLAGCGGGRDGTASPAAVSSPSSIASPATGATASQGGSGASGSSALVADSTTARGAVESGPTPTDADCDGSTYSSGGQYDSQFGKPGHAYIGPFYFKAITADTPAVRICVREFSAQDSAIPVTVRQLMGTNPAAITRIQAVGAFDEVADKRLQLFLKFHAYGDEESNRQAGSLQVGLVTRQPDGTWTRSIIPSTQLRETTQVAGGGQWRANHIMMRADVTEPGYYYIDRP